MRQGRAGWHGGVAGQGGMAGWQGRVAGQGGRAGFVTFAEQRTPGGGGQHLHVLQGVRPQVLGQVLGHAPDVQRWRLQLAAALLEDAAGA